MRTLNAWAKGGQDFPGKTGGGGEILFSQKNIKLYYFWLAKTDEGGLLLPGSCIRLRAVSEQVEDVSNLLTHRPHWLKNEIVDNHYSEIMFIKLVHKLVS